MEITKEIFETHLPSFKCAGYEVYDKMQEPLQMLSESEEIEAKEKYCTPTLLPLLERAVCLEAAWKTVPQLDLVLTPTGFGIVSNSQTAPASKERVAALIENLRQRKSEAYDALHFELLKTDWRETTDAKYNVLDSLLWNATLWRRYGIKVNGQPVYDEEKQAQDLELSIAEDNLDALISPDLHTKLIDEQTTDPEKIEPAVALAIERARKYMACVIMHTPPRALHNIGHSLLDVIRRNIDVFPEYAGSTEYAAQTAARYANRKEDRTFFFG